MSGLFALAMLWVRSWGDGTWAQIGAASYLEIPFYVLLGLVPFNTIAVIIFVIRKKSGFAFLAAALLASLIFGLSFLL
jgi:hypothetical protein